MLVIAVAIGAAVLGTKRYVVRAGAVLTSHASSPEIPPPAKADRFDFSTLWLSHNPAPDLGVHAQAAYVVDLDTRLVLWERDADTMRAPASLTKMITAMVAMDDAGSLDRTIEVTKDSTTVYPSLMGLAAGEHLTVREVLYGLFLSSGNDAAEALAQGIVPRDRFVRQMNQKAKSIGLQASHFVNPTGFDDTGHGMSAHDLARAAAYLDKYYPELAAIAGTKDKEIPSTTTHQAYAMQNLNALLTTYPGATGLKTGLTPAAGACAVITATRNGRHLVVVVMNDTSHAFGDSAALLDYGFSVKPALTLASLKSA